MMICTWDSYGQNKHGKKSTANTTIVTILAGEQIFSLLVSIGSILVSIVIILASIEQVNRSYDPETK